jgi:hypothetical protein
MRQGMFTAAVLYALDRHGSASPAELGAAMEIEADRSHVDMVGALTEDRLRAALLCLVRAGRAEQTGERFTARRGSAT